MYDSRPGYADFIPLGGSYAQPSVTPAAIPEGNCLEQSMAWCGLTQLAGAPLYDSNVRENTEIIRVLGIDITGSGVGAKRGGSADGSAALSQLIRRTQDYLQRFASASGSTRQMTPAETQLFYGGYA